MAEQRGQSEPPPTPAPARPAATVILARRAEPGFEVLLLRRLANASAFADVFVFPGGAVRFDDYAPDPGDAGFGAEDALAAFTARGSQPPADAELARALFRAAIRELFEEAGILLVCDASGQPFRILEADGTRWSTYRDALQADRLTLSDLLRQERLTPDYRRLIYFSHWITPEFAPRRFDTRFFVAEAPPEQTAVHCQIETTESVWIRPAEALAREAAGTLPLVLPTRMHLRRLAEAATLADLLAFAATKAVRTVEGTRQGETMADVIAMTERMAQTW
jgi:8-oxo-dGTP pyrophosphatase MutT (NUDIX family)